MPLPRPTLFEIASGWPNCPKQTVGDQVSKIAWSSSPWFRFSWIKIIPVQKPCHPSIRVSPWYGCSDHSGFGLNQCQTMLQCNVFSRWLNPYQEWSLRWHVCWSISGLNFIALQLSLFFHRLGGNFFIMAILLLYTNVFLCILHLLIKTMRDCIIWQQYTFLWFQGCMPPNCFCRCKCYHNVCEYYIYIGMKIINIDSNMQAFHDECILQGIAPLYEYMLFVDGSQIARFMGPTWGPPGSCRTQMGPMLAPRTLLLGFIDMSIKHFAFTSLYHPRVPFCGSRNIYCIFACNSLIKSHCSTSYVAGRVRLHQFLLFLRIRIRWWRLCVTNDNVLCVPRSNINVSLYILKSR